MEALADGEERAFFLLSITRNYVVSVRRGFLFLLVHKLGALVYCGITLDSI